MATLRTGTASGAFNRVRFGSKRTGGLVVVATAGGMAYAFQLPPPSKVPRSGTMLPAGLHAEGAELTPVVTFKGHTGSVRDIAVGENGEVLATASQDRSIRLWKLRTGEHCRALPGGGDVLALSFSSSGAANLAAATAKGVLKVFGIVPRGAQAGMLAFRLE